MALGPTLSIGFALASSGCSVDETRYAPDSTAAAGGAGLPRVTTEPEALAVDVLGTPGNRYYFVVSDDQLDHMNQRYGGGGFGEPGGDIYRVGGEASAVTFVDQLFVSTPGPDPDTADFGKVQVKLVGESSGRAWTTSSLPNFKIDAEEFKDGQHIGGVKHLRLNNALMGGIFKEKLTYDLYRALGYPAPRAGYAWVQSSVWGPGIEVPYIVVESYKPAFCKQREAELAGGCVNMWEYTGYVGDGQLGSADSCQFSECDPRRAIAFESVAVATPQGAGFKAALAEWLDWDAFHRFQCLSWIFDTADDAIHNGNNAVIMERTDGKFQHLPYSVDMSLGQEYFSAATLAGRSLLARGCQSDAQCWSELIGVCEGMVDQFIAANPIAMLDQIYALLSDQGMLRDGDEDRYHTLSDYLGRRMKELRVELEDNRGGPPAIMSCDSPLVDCDGVCMLPEDC